MSKILLTLAFRPHLWITAVRQLLVLAPTGWWRRPPFLPLPDSEYLAFRMETMYGDCAAAPGVSDVVTYLEWCRNQRQALR